MSAVVNMTGTKDHTLDCRGALRRASGALALALTLCAWLPASLMASTSTIGSASGTFDSNFTGMVVQGAATRVNGLGPINPTQG